jgi:hypothetical protein
MDADKREKTSRMVSGFVQRDRLSNRRIFICDHLPFLSVATLPAF